jgi:hypothetical protein
MKFGKITAAVFMAVAAVGVTAGTADAQPAAVAQGVTKAGVEKGISYSTTLSGDAKAVSTAVNSGHFALTDNGTAVTLTSNTGETVAKVPLVFHVAGRTLSVAEQIDQGAHNLTLTPRVTPEDVAALKNVNSYSNLIQQLDQNIVGEIVGGVIGGVIGSALGVGILSFVTGPVGLLAGAAIGGAAEGGQPYIDALTAFAQGRP